MATLAEPALLSRLSENIGQGIREGECVCNRLPGSSRCEHHREKGSCPTGGIICCSRFGLTQRINPDIHFVKSVKTQ